MLEFYIIEHMERKLYEKLTPLRVNFSLLRGYVECLCDWYKIL